MKRDITLGQYFPGDSFLHRLDPRAKVIISILYMTAVFCAKNIWFFALMMLVTVASTLLGKIRIGLILNGLRPLIWVMLFTSILSIFFFAGEGTPLFSFGFLHVYTEGIIRAVLIALRVVMFVVGASVFLTYTTSPIRLTDALESLLSPLKVFHLPVHEFAMMMTIALRFIPTLIEETEKIIKAQKARGADFDAPGLLRRVRALIPILLPLFSSAFQHALDLATAMECRCYRGGKGRTKYYELRFRAVDFVSVAVMAVILAAVIASNSFSWAGAIL